MADIWRVYYADGSYVQGSSAQEWLAAPASGVQVVVLYKPTDYRGWRGTNGDRQLWTGEDWFDPFDWGPKGGLLISDTDYFAIWERAVADSPPTPS